MHIIGNNKVLTSLKNGKDTTPMIKTIGGIAHM
jgi:hypothetical protein